MGRNSWVTSHGSRVNSRPNGLRTWIEIDSRAAKKNYETFRGLVGQKTKLWAVVKSNAYGHGLTVFSKLLEKLGADGLCVDSIVEGVRLREEGIRIPILVLGSTLPSFLGEAAKKNITLTVSSENALRELLGARRTPRFHLKIDTGMHRQGFYVKDLPMVIKQIKSHKSQVVHSPQGMYTHFASAKDINYPTYTERQFENFKQAIEMFEKAGFTKLVKHCAATGATLIDRKYHLDAIRIGIGLYGLYPSRELELQLRRPGGGRSPDLKASGLPNILLYPVLSWRTAVSEIKPIAAGDYVGYDLSARAVKPTKIAILPVGYWHGFGRALSGFGQALIRGRRVPVIGKVSMDMMAVDVGAISCRTGDAATLIGRDGGEELSAQEVAEKAGTTHYEFLTRLNPLMERVIL